MRMTDHWSGLSIQSPGPGETGHDTWPADNEVWKFGGATVWQTPAVDPELGLLYFATGNPGPDFNGAVRAGDNLFSVSIVAVDVATGEYRWHFQQVRHDLWDFDAANPVVLFGVEIDGVSRKAVAEVNKNGYIYILDRVTGEPLLGMVEKPVPQEPRQATAATQPIPFGEPITPVTIDVPPEGYTLPYDEHVYVPFWTERVVGSRRGANWPPSAYDPQRQTLYVCASERLSFYFVDEDETASPPGGERYMGGRFGGVGGLPSTGILAAMDMTTNTPVWRQRWADRCYSGAVATASGLLFVGRSDGRFMAFDSDTGMSLWEFQTGAGVNTTPAIFEYEGEQHVAIFSAGNAFAGSPRGDSVWLFSLSGTLDPVAAPPPSGRGPGRNGCGGPIPDRHAESRQRRDGLCAGVRTLPWAGRSGRPRRGRGAHSGKDFGGGRARRDRGAKHHAGVRRGAFGERYPGCERLRDRSGPGIALSIASGGSGIRQRTVTIRSWSVIFAGTVAASDPPRLWTIRDDSRRCPHVVAAL